MNLSAETGDHRTLLVFSHEFPPHVGGAGVVAQQNARVLARTGYDVTVLTRQRPGAVLKSEYRVRAAPNYGKLWFLAFRKALEYSAFDVILLNDPAAIYTAGLFFDTALLERSICFVHGSEPELVLNTTNPIKKWTFFSNIYMRTIRRAKLVVCPSHYMKKKILEATNGLGINPSKFLVVYAGVDRNQFYHDPKKNFFQRWQIPEACTVLLSVSRVTEGKGYSEKIRIFEKLAVDDPDIYWIIVGSGGYSEKLETLINEKHLKGRVILAGTQPRECLRDFYSNADVFWLLSNQDECFGLVYLEAQACGLPVIGRNKAGVREAIRHNETGFLIDTEDECREIVAERKWKSIDRRQLGDFSNRFRMDDIASVVADTFS